MVDKLIDDAKAIEIVRAIADILGATGDEKRAAALLRNEFGFAYIQARNAEEDRIARWLEDTHT